MKGCPESSREPTLRAFPRILSQLLAKLFALLLHDSKKSSTVVSLIQRKFCKRNCIIKGVSTRDSLGPEMNQSHKQTDSNHARLAC